MMDLPDRLRWRHPQLIAAVLGYIYEADAPVPLRELVDVLADAEWKPRTIENLTTELVEFGALHRTGKASTRTTADSRTLRPTLLGAAWLEQELRPLPTMKEEP